uniref:Uncharacterized protein n=1 Tax=Anolis carolinensis TaxID=28377 RepID=A0A803TWH5_ANOCA
MGLIDNGNLRPLPYDFLPSSLTTLELTAPACKDFPRIQHLIIQNVPAFSNQHLFNISRQGTLKTLVLSKTFRVTDVGIQTAAPHLGGLEHLTLLHTQIGNSAMHFIGRHMKCLRSLHLGDYTSPTPNPHSQHPPAICLSSFP